MTEFTIFIKSNETVGQITQIFDSWKLACQSGVNNDYLPDLFFSCLPIFIRELLSKHLVYFRI